MLLATVLLAPALLATVLLATVLLSEALAVASKAATLSKRLWARLRMGGPTRHPFMRTSWAPVEPSMSFLADCTSKAEGP